MSRETDKPAVRQFIFRVLSGSLALMFGWYLFFATRPPLSLKKTASFTAIMAMFIVHAMVGEQPRESWIWRLIGKRRQRFPAQNGET